MVNVRVRFAPSPTGPLHIGGVRTALFNYLFSKRHNGVFVLRIEDTDQNRYVDEAEEYIRESLAWCGLTPDEGPEVGGDHGPYRQSERADLYQKAVQELLYHGKAYYAFDTAEELDAMRLRKQEAGQDHAKYDHHTRQEMRNSLTLSDSEVSALLKAGIPYTIRLKVEPGRSVGFQDMIRGEIEFNTNELDDKVLMKSDGLPTYHLANVVDDLAMDISHIIRGEEWLSSTPHHVLLYEAFGRLGDMPNFAHLPLILKPAGKGKLSKRDGSKLGIPVFPMTWSGKEESFVGFRELGFIPQAVVNFLAFLGWNPGTDQEIFSLKELIQNFTMDGVSKSGARFDFEKSLWFNQQYIQQMSNEVLSRIVQGRVDDSRYNDEVWVQIAELIKPRIQRLDEIENTLEYFMSAPETFDEKSIKKKWKSPGADLFNQLIEQFDDLEDWDANQIKQQVETGMEEYSVGYSGILPLLRIAVTGSVQGPDIFKVMAILGKQESMSRMNKGVAVFNEQIPS